MPGLQHPDSMVLSLHSSPFSCRRHAEKQDSVRAYSKQYEKRHWSNWICSVLRRARYRVTQRQAVA